MEDKMQIQKGIAYKPCGDVNVLRTLGLGNINLELDDDGFLAPAVSSDFNGSIYLFSENFHKGTKYDDRTYSTRYDIGKLMSKSSDKKISYSLNSGENIISQLAMTWNGVLYVPEIVAENKPETGFDRTRRRLEAMMQGSPSRISPTDFDL